MIKFFIFGNYVNFLLFLVSFFTISMRQFRILLDFSEKIGFYLKQINHVRFSFPYRVRLWYVSYIFTQ